MLTTRSQKSILRGTDPLIASAQDHWFTFVQDSKAFSYVNLFVRILEVRVPIIDEVLLSRTETGFDSYTKNNTLAAIKRLSVSEEPRIYSRTEKWSIGACTVYAPFGILEFQAVTTLQQYALSLRLDVARSETA